MDFFTLSVFVGVDVAIALNIGESISGITLFIRWWLFDGCQRKRKMKRVMVCLHACNSTSSWSQMDCCNYNVLLKSLKCMSAARDDRFVAFCHTSKIFCWIGFVMPRNIRFFR
jgi:hypothetical protein